MSSRGMGMSRGGAPRGGGGNFGGRGGRGGRGRGGGGRGRGGPGARGPPRKPRVELTEEDKRRELTRRLEETKEMLRNLKVRKNNFCKKDFEKG